ncbi:MAG: MarR family winged helix-turn-helix transcriptional regulator [Pseudonocardia sp.]|nr:MarR family winged helix-turn-helix transcriptional regulator [Pseudonocardia sp.]
MGEQEAAAAAGVAIAAQDPAALVGELMRLNSAVVQVLARELGLSLTDLTALHHLVERPSAGPVELGKRLGMSSASATVLVDRLERAGHVRRRRDPADRRRVVLEVTEAAAAQSLEAVRPLVDAVAAIDDDLDQPARQAVAIYLARVADAMTAFTGQ